MCKWQKSSLIAAACMAAVFAYTNVARRSMPSDLRDAVADGASVLEFENLRRVTASGVQPATDYPVPTKSSATGTEAAIALARALLDKSLERKNEYPDEKFWQSVKDLRAAFNNPFIIKTAACGRETTLMFTLKTDYYPELSGRKKNIIRICKGYKPAVELMAQDFLHETSHLALTTLEDEATELEMVVTHLGGGYPVLSGYVSYNENLTAEELSWLGYGFLPLTLGITSKTSFKYQQLRAAIVYDDYELFVRGMNNLKDIQAELLAYVDFKGFTLADSACQPQRQRFAAYLQANCSGVFTGCK